MSAGPHLLRTDVRRDHLADRVHLGGPSDDGSSGGTPSDPHRPGNARGGLNTSSSNFRSCAHGSRSKGNHFSSRIARMLIGKLSEIWKRWRQRSIRRNQIVGMPYFRCFIHGEGLRSDQIESSGGFGFYTTRFVNAANGEEAKNAAMKMIREELKLPPIRRPTLSEPLIRIEEVEEVDASEVPDTQYGFVCYPLDDQRTE